MFTHQNKNIINFLLKTLPLQKIVPNLTFIIWNFFLNFSFEYSFISIVKLKFTRRNEMWCRILEIEDLSKKVRKAQDRTSLKSSGILYTGKYSTLFYFHLFSLHHQWANFSFFNATMLGDFLMGQNSMKVIKLENKKGQKYPCILYTFCAFFFAVKLYQDFLV